MADSETRYYDPAQLMWYRKRGDAFEYAFGTLKGINPVRGWYLDGDAPWIESRLSCCMKLTVTADSA